MSQNESESKSVPGEFQVASDGWCAQVQHIPSPNYDARPAGTRISLLVIHNISLPLGQFGTPFISALFTNQLDCDVHPSFDDLRAIRVSAHFLIRRDGKVIQFVSADERAWHAGVSSFAGRVRCNDFSIGIELEGTDFECYTDAQYEALVRLTGALRDHYLLDHVAGHEHIAPGRKTDPGPYFDWARYQKMLLDPTSAEDAKSCQNRTILHFPSIA